MEMSFDLFNPNVFNAHYYNEHMEEVDKLIDEIVNKLSKTYFDSMGDDKDHKYCIFFQCKRHETKYIKPNYIIFESDRELSGSFYNISTINKLISSSYPYADLFFESNLESLIKQMKIYIFNHVLMNNKYIVNISMNKYNSNRELIDSITIYKN